MIEDQDQSVLEEEAHLAHLFLNRANRFLRLLDLSKTKGLPTQLLDKERELVGVAAVMWVAMHALEDEPNGGIQQQKGREMVREGMGRSLQTAEETWTAYVMSDEFTNNPEIKRHIVEKPKLTLHQGGQGGNGKKD